MSVLMGSPTKPSQRRVRWGRGEAKDRSEVFRFSGKRNGVDLASTRPADGYRREEAL